MKKWTDSQCKVESGMEIEKDRCFLIELWIVICTLWIVNCNYFEWLKDWRGEKEFDWEVMDRIEMNMEDWKN